MRPLVPALAAFEVASGPILLANTPLDAPLLNDEPRSSPAKVERRGTWLILGQRHLYAVGRELTLGLAAVYAALAARLVAVSEGLAALGALAQDRRPPGKSVMDLLQ